MTILLPLLLHYKEYIHNKYIHNLHYRDYIIYNKECIIIN